MNEGSEGLPSEDDVKEEGPRLDTSVWVAASEIALNGIEDGVV